MPKASGIGDSNRSRFGGGTRSLGDAFQPNLAMGGGSYRIPLDLPSGPGGISPKVEFNYDTSAGNGPFGLGWSISLPFVARLRPRPYASGQEPEFALAGGLPMVPTDDGGFVPAVAERAQRFELNADVWTSRTLELSELRFGATENARVSGSAGGPSETHRWLIDRMRFPGGRDVTSEYLHDGGQAYPLSIRWSVFRLDFLWEDRPDPWNQYDTGFPIRTAKRCSRIELHHTGLAPHSRIRTIEFSYREASYTRTSLLERVVLTGWKRRDGDWESASLPALEFAYTPFSPESRAIEKLRGLATPPPRLSADTTLVDLDGSGMPDVLRLNRRGGTFWENRGGGEFGPPRQLARVPAGIALSDRGVRFADMEGRGKADLVVGLGQGGGYYPNAAGSGIGFRAKRTLALQPSFDIGEPGSHLLDLDGDRVADLLTFRGRSPMAFLNRGGRQWEGPIVLSDSGLPRDIGSEPEMRLADMTGDGLPDVVRMRSRHVTYFPNLGNGRFGAERAMADSPAFELATRERAFLGDVSGSGAADLVVNDRGEIRIYLNRAGEGFSDPVVLVRAPDLAAERTLLADMKGSGTAGLLFMSPRSASGAVSYWFLDLLAGVKPNLLQRIDNNAGLVTDVEYSTSARERARDLRAGRRWTGYLPFVVPVVRQLTANDTVTGQGTSTVFTYHDGHFDGHSREYLGFAEVESLKTASPQEAPERRRMFYHTRNATARDPAFVAGRGQPHRTEMVDPTTGSIYRREEADWTTQQVAGTSEDRPGYLALQQRRSSVRLESGTPFEAEDSTFEYDTVGNVVRERRCSTWTDVDGISRVDELDIWTRYATHATQGITTFKSQIRKISGGRLLSDVRSHYDGDPFVGLPAGQVAQGFKTRQVEVALTDHEIAEAYDGAAPAELADHYTTEVDPAFGTLYLRDAGRARVDASGNEIEAIDADGSHRVFEFDDDGIHPISISEDGDGPLTVTYDRVAQLISSVEDLNGHVTSTEYDPLGFTAAVYRPGALPGKPTESYEYVRDRVPNAIAQRMRVAHDDVVAGAVKVDYYDGTGRKCQTKTLSETGTWAVGRQEILSVAGRRLGIRDAYFSLAVDFTPVPPAGTASTELHLDADGRIVRERLFNGRWTSHEYERNRVRFFGPDAHDARALNPTTPPTRESVLDTRGLATAIIERDAGRTLTVRRTFDAERRLTRVLDPEGHVSLDNVFDLGGNRIRVRSTEGGDTVFVFNAGKREVRRTDADGRILVSVRDQRGRVRELREGASETLIESYSYDVGTGSNVDGRLGRVEGQFGTIEYGYSPDGQATHIRRTYPGTAGSFETRFAYNNRRDVTQVTYPDGSVVAYHYHPTGTLASIPGFIDAVEYGPTGLRTRIAYANGLECRRGYTPGDYLIDELLTQQTGGGHRFQHLVYTLDGVGQAVKVDDLSTVPGKMRLNQTYEYDDRNRLIRAKGSVARFDYQYAYDDLGNLVSNGETGDAFVFGREVGDTSAPNRLVRRRAASGVEYRYDASGNLIADPDMGEMTYDSRHRLVRVDRPDGSMVEYAYDHHDRRVSTTVRRGTEVETRLEVDGLYLVENGGASRVVFDEDRRMAVVPASGDAVIHHFDRLGNVNVLSNANTGAFAGHDEYTPYGQLFVSIVIEPAFSFQGGRFSDGLGIVLLGARHYRPDHGRFLTCDPFLYRSQDSAPPLHIALNLYVYAYANPTNFTDPTGEIAPIVIAIIVAAIVGAIIGVAAAAANGAQTWEEWFLYIIGGAIGGILTVLFWYGILVLLGVGALAAASAALVITVVASFASLFTPLLDDSDSEAAWAFSFIIKLVKSPVLTILGLFVVAGFAIAGNRVDFRRGALFVEVGGGMSGLTLGAIVYTQSGFFQADGTVRDDYARHEAYHTRQAAALGELGFYLTYVTLGSIFAGASGGPWNGLDASGCGNPFESHAYTFYDPNIGGPNPNEVGTTSC